MGELKQTAMSSEQATTAGNVLGASSLENRQAERQARMARLKAANRASKLSSTSTSFMPVGFRAEIKNLQYDLRNTMLEVSEEKEAVARDLASLRKLEHEGPHNLDIKESTSDFVRKNGSSNLTQIPAYLEYCQMKDVERGVHYKSALTTAPAKERVDELIDPCTALALVPANSRRNMHAAHEELQEQKGLIEQRLATADPEAVSVLQEELEHVERMLLEAEASIDF